MDEISRPSSQRCDSVVDSRALLFREWRHTIAQMTPLTPMQQQYAEIRKGLPPHTLLLFRLGDFYEMFDHDADEGARILGITLTARNGRPMAGIPYHAADGYVRKLLAAGRRVAICDQMEAPQPGKIVKRSLTRILTPGTTLDDHHIEARRHHYLLALDGERQTLLAAWLDLSTGEFRLAAEGRLERLLPVLHALDPREVLVPERSWQKWLAAVPHDDPAGAALAEFCRSRPVTPLADGQFDPRDGWRLVADTLGVLSLDGFGIPLHHPALGPAGALITYATESLQGRPRNLRSLREYRPGGSLLLDPATQRNLEIFRQTNGAREGSLLHAMDATVTAPGARLLEQYLTEPVLDRTELKRRQRLVGVFIEAPMPAAEMQEYLKQVRDIPRALSRLKNRLASPRELGGIRSTLRQLPLVVRLLATLDDPVLATLAGPIKEFPELRDLLERALQEELAVQLADGGYIRDGYDLELNRLRDLSRGSKEWILEMERAEQVRTGIRNLKIRYTGAFGYYIEVTKSNLALVPDHYIRKQTTVNSERYYTPELKEKEKEILHAEEKGIAREQELFKDLCQQVLACSESLGQAAAALAEIDVYLGWARLAREWDYCRPEIDESDVIEINQGRHPVVEQILRRQRDGSGGAGSFVPNDVKLSSGTEQIAILTGPNMAGKSTYIRQVALIIIMAQTGSWVPAKSCRIGLVDRIFSRIGASDELARGHSTFMVEMNETANILNNCTPRSLIILDEVGRGTSTYDGLAIAWAVVEHLHGSEATGPRTLFATHYHELTQLDRQCSRVRNYHVAVKEWNDQIIFVRQVNPGPAERSFGIHVARLAGLPEAVLQRAGHILARLESEESAHNLLRLRLKQSRAKNPTEGQTDQMVFF